MTETITALPAPIVPDPHETPAKRWGILGTGWIAAQFVTALQQSTSQIVQAVGSRGAARAAEFAEQFGIATSYGSYEELVADDSIDVVYIASSHLDHFAHAKLAIEAGKPVLVEKPFTTTLAQAEELAALAREKGVFAMEAVWTLALPRFSVVRQIIDQGVLGDIKSVGADIGENLMDHHRAMDPKQGGGAMNDLGSYTLMFANEMIPNLKVAAARGQRHPEHGTMSQINALLEDGEGRQATVAATMWANSPTTAYVVGTEALMVLDTNFYRPGPVEVRFPDGRVLTYEEERIDHAGLFWEALEVAQCLEQGLTESPKRPLDGSIATIRLVEEAREAMGDPLSI